MNLGHTQSCEGWRRRKPECPEGSIPQHLLVTSLAKESRALPISQAGTEPWSGIRSFITTPSLLLEKHCAQSHLLKQTGLPPVLFLLLFHREQLLPAGCCTSPVPGCLPEGRQLFLLLALKERWFGHRFIPAWNAITPASNEKITAIAQIITCQHFWSRNVFSSLSRKAGLQERKALIRAVVFCPGIEESLLDFLCCQVREQEG